MRPQCKILRILWRFANPYLKSGKRWVPFFGGPGENPANSCPFLRGVYCGLRSSFFYRRFVCASVGYWSRRRHWHWAEPRSLAATAAAAAEVVLGPGPGLGLGLGQVVPRGQGPADQAEPAPPVQAQPAEPGALGPEQVQALLAPLAARVAPVAPEPTAPAAAPAAPEAAAVDPAPGAAPQEALVLPELAPADNGKCRLCSKERGARAFHAPLFPLCLFETT
jgi:hypothetical protein